jgi:hypothetical protein
LSLQNPNSFMPFSLQKSTAKLEGADTAAKYGIFAL